MKKPPPNSEDPTLEQEAPKFDGTSTDQLDAAYRVDVVPACKSSPVREPPESPSPAIAKAVITWRGGAETVEASSLTDPKLQPLLERLAATRARDISVDFIGGHECNRDGLPTSLTEEVDGRPVTAIYPTCATCGKPQIR